MNKEWKIYTKTGDSGETSLIGGSRVPKYHQRIEAYGTLDELNSFIGYLRDQIEEEPVKNILRKVQENLFTCESLLAAEPEVEASRHLPQLYEEDILLLEHEIDEMNKVLPELKSFILPGGHPLVSLAHVCRTVCRRAERITVKLASEGKFEHGIILRYLNRLSDYCFVLSRKLAYDRQLPDQKWEHQGI